MPNFKRKFISLSLLLLIFSVANGLFLFPVFADAKSAASDITQAEKTIIECYDATRAAERAGASITDLLIVLNEAGMLLSDANFAYNKGDYDSASSLAVESREKLDGFITQANALAETAMQENSRDFMMNVVWSLVTALGIICVGAIVWIASTRKQTNTERVVS
jgi:hypothetical protein